MTFNIIYLVIIQSLFYMESQSFLGFLFVCFLLAKNCINLSIYDNGQCLDKKTRTNAKEMPILKNSK